MGIFDLQVTKILPTKFRVNWLFGSEEEAKKKIQDSGCCSHLGFPIIMSLAILIYIHPNAFYQVSGQLAQRFRRRRAKKISKIAAMAAILHVHLERIYS